VFNMQKMLKQVQKVQEDMARVQEALAQERVEATAGGGVVRAGASTLITVASPHAATLAAQASARARRKVLPIIWMSSPRSGFDKIHAGANGWNGSEKGTA